MMGDVGSANSSWRMRDASASADSFQNPYSAFRNYSRTASNTSFSESSQGSSNQRNWRASSVWRNQSSANHIGAVYNNYVTAQSGDSGIVHNSDISEYASQPLYADKTQDNFRKGRAQRSQFRVNSTYTLGSNKQTDIYSFQHSYKTLGTSSFLWNGLSPHKSPWSPPVTDATPQALYSLKDLTIGESNLDSNTASSQHMPVELQISNLDQNIEAREMKRILFTIFREHVMVLHVSVFVQSDGNLAATIRIPSLQDAQFAISQLHRRRIGAKRITISYVNHNQPSPELKRSKVIALLQEIPGKRLPLFKFRELYERRYHESIGVSEMYNMRDIVTVSDNTTGRMVSLHPEFRYSNNQLTETAHQESSGSLIPRFCSVHSSEPDESIGWAERDQTPPVPSIQMPLRILGPNIHLLLQSHSGSIPLASLVDCYRAEIGPIEEDENGVPLEHLVSCLPGVYISCESGGFKHIQWFENKSVDENEELARCVSLPLVGQLDLFSRELVDLLKTFSSSRLLLSRFIPAYHHHFGRQCRVADYGFTKLADLFEALPYVVQIIGEGNKRQLTLAHKAQVKRFSSDLLRVLKRQPTKSITVDAFPEMFKRVLGKEWNVTDYGVCDIEDLLVEVAEVTVVISRTSTETTISIPKREQTPEEMERTRQFAVEVVELLRHSPRCKMAFNRFIPAYHHHFGRQCRVADYGFSKLIELFEAVPHVLQVFDEDGEKEIQLIEREKLRVLGDQVSTLVKGAPRHAIRLSALSQVFVKYYGYSLRPQHYGAESLQDLLSKLRSHVKIVEAGDEPVVTLVDRGYVHEVMIQARRILWDESSCSMQLKRFSQVYTDANGRPPNIDVIKKDLEDVLVIDEDEEEATIKLVSLQIFARDLLTLLHEAGGRMLLSNFENAYLDRFGVACRPATYGFPNLIALVHSLGDLVSIRGRGTKRILVLNKDTVPSPPASHAESPSHFMNEDNDATLEKLSQPSTFNLPELPPATVDVQQSVQDVPTGSQPLMGQSHTLPYQPHSPIVYSGGSTPGGGSMMWGQVWSPQYPIMSPLSPAHYMVPALSMSWGSLPNPPVLPPLNTSFQNSPPGTQSSVPPPISIDTLDQLVAPPQIRTDVDPPSASELPTPQFLDHASMISQPVAVVMKDNGQVYHDVGIPNPVGQTEEDTWSGCSGERDQHEDSLNPTQPRGKPLVKRRLAAQFHAN